MGHKKDKKGIPFKEFLDKSTSLFTLFGIFNALLIYTTSINDEIIALFLIIPFFLLTILICYEIIIFAFKSDNNSRKYDFFIHVIIVIEFVLIWYFIRMFIGLIVGLAFVGIIFLVPLLITFLFLKVFRKQLLRVGENKFTFIKISVFFVIFIINVIVLEITNSKYKPFIEKIVSTGLYEAESTEVKNDKIVIDTNTIESVRLKKDSVKLNNNEIAKDTISPKNINDK